MKVIKVLSIFLVFLISSNVYSQNWRGEHLQAYFEYFDEHNLSEPKILYLRGSMLSTCYKLEAPFVEVFVRSDINFYFAFYDGKRLLVFEYSLRDGQYKRIRPRKSTIIFDNLGLNAILNDPFTNSTLFRPDWTDGVIISYAIWARVGLEDTVFFHQARPGYFNSDSY